MKNPFELHFSFNHTWQYNPWSGMHSKIYLVRDILVKYMYQYLLLEETLKKYRTIIFYFYHKHVTV